MWEFTAIGFKVAVAGDGPPARNGIADVLANEMEKIEHERKGLNGMDGIEHERKGELIGWDRTWFRRC